MSDDSKRRSRLGTKQEVSPGVWRIRMSCGYRSDGTQRRVSRTVRGTSRDADAALVRLADDMGRCMAIGDDMTLDEYFHGYFLPMKEATTTKANAKTYESIYRAHIADEFGSSNLNQIDNIRIQHWVNGLPPQSAANYVRALRAILNQAHFDHVMLEQPMGPEYKYRLPRGRRNAPKPVWGAPEVAECMRRLAGDEQLFPLWCCMVGAGLSRSEALALDWEDIAWSKVLGMDGREHWSALLTVEQAYTAVDGMKEPKNDRRYRTVPLRPPFSDALRDHLGTGPICQSRHGSKLTGRRLTPCYVPRRWKALFAEGGALHGMPWCEIGRMRATYSTLMQRAGVESSVINAMQGRTTNSPVLYTNYLNPGNDTYTESADTMARLMRFA